MLLRGKISGWLRPAVWGCALAIAGCANFQLPRIDPTGERLFVPAGTPPPPRPIVVAPPPSASSPVFSSGPAGPPLQAPAQPLPVMPGSAPAAALPAPPAFPPPAPPGAAPALDAAPGGIPQPGLTLSPAQIIAPVGSEVVMIASILGPEGYPLTRERIEWMLQAGEPGKFVALGQRGTFDCLNLIRGLPRKVDNTYAINTTSTGPVTLDHGTPTLSDDIVVQGGQAYVTITSSSEGTSHVTAYAPSVAQWDRRQQRATIYWTDALPSFPAPSIGPVGSRHMLTTSVARQSDGAPIAGWRIRYEITGGPEAGFAPDGSSVVEVATNDLGQGNAEIFQKQPGAGTNQIGIQVIRPASAVGGGRELAIRGGSTLRTWTSSEISVRTVGPAEGSVGSIVTYRIEVTNPGGVPARDVVVTDQAAPGLQFLNSNPAAATSPSGQEWRLGEIASRQTRLIEVNFRVTQAGELGYCTSVTAADGLTGKDCARTIATAGRLELNIVGPPSAEVGQEVKFEVQLTNRGDIPATELVIRDAFDVGLEHAASASPIERSLTDLAPGATRRIAVTFRVTRPGELCQNVEVRGQGGLQASTRACITVTQPPIVPPATPPLIPPAGAPIVPKGEEPAARGPTISVRVTGPSLRKVGESAEFVIDVKNIGDVPLTNVRVADSSEPALETSQATGGWVKAEGVLAWRFDSIAPGKTKRLRVICRCAKESVRACNRATVTADPGLTMADEACVQIVGEAAAPPPADDASPPPAAAPASKAGALTLSVADSADPVTVGGETIYQIVLTNDSDQPDRSVIMTATVPPGMKLLEMKGPGRPVVATIRGRELQFTTIAEMRAREAINFSVSVRAEQAGAGRFTVSVTSERQRTPAGAEERTQIIER